MSQSVLHRIVFFLLKEGAKLAALYAEKRILERELAQREAKQQRINNEARLEAEVAALRKQLGYAK